MLSSRLCLRAYPFFHRPRIGLFPPPPPPPPSSPSELRPGTHLAATPACCLPTPRVVRRGFAASAGSDTPPPAPQQEENGEINITAVSSADLDDTPDPVRNRMRRRWNRRGLFPVGGGIGNALWRATESMQRLMRDLPTPPHLFRRVKEEDKAYKVQLGVPGLSKDDLRVTVEGDYLVIKGEKKQEAEESGDEEGEYWTSSRSYGYCNTWLMLPEDAKADEIKAEAKHGVLHVTIPRAEEKRAEVREVEVQ